MSYHIVFGWYPGGMSLLRPQPACNLLSQTEILSRLNLRFSGARQRPTSRNHVIYVPRRPG